MTLASAYRDARRDEEIARLRRVLALRAMLATGMSQSGVARELGISQPAVSQQLKFAPNLDAVHPADLVRAAAPVLTALAGERGYGHLAVFGSVARREARPESDVDLLVEAPEGTSSLEFVAFARLLAQVLGREVDLVEYGSLRPGLDDDIRRDAVLL
ncbi:nucleotidyltransferase domain-containing protein [Demequina sp. SYSU T00192]|uniref:Nucleotidyltransferase domain-containing protein n=1 Tax=Demequina litoralis TaxID=3051660 RepID=A0ABT8G9Y9_9MICO|nr:nucleotidyltransferase domain-containing protein [Demequina sp. SYSU T00192]MDN4475794.1 nucleotidyltransferase domain-containing protein [Demequina sp. SYSU T00192]